MASDLHTYECTFATICILSIREMHFDIPKRIRRQTIIYIIQNISFSAFLEWLAGIICTPTATLCNAHYPLRTQTNTHYMIESPQVYSHDFNGESLFDGNNLVLHPYLVIAFEWLNFNIHVSFWRAFVIENGFSVLSSLSLDKNSLLL